MSTLPVASPEQGLPAQRWFEEHYAEVLSRARVLASRFPRPERDDCIAEIMAESWRNLCSAAARGRLHRITPFTLTVFATGAYAQGRRLANSNSTDVLSPATQHKHGLKVLSLDGTRLIRTPEGLAHLPLHDVLADKRAEPPPDDAGLSEETRMDREFIPLHKLQLPAFGAWEPGWFLLTAGENRPGGFNSMTVSWGALGVIWGRPLAIVVVRPQRYTRQFMERYDTFSLCAFDEAYRPALNLLGTRSGRDTPKMSECGLTPIALSTIACPGFAEARLILECRKTYFDDLDPAHFLAEYIAPNYKGDYHRMYFGEVLAAAATAEFRRRS